MTETEDLAELGQPADKAEKAEPGDKGARRRSAGATVKNYLRVGNLYGANFGAGTPRVVATALKRAAEVEAELRRYVPPPCFGEAKDLLQDGNVVVLEGQSGLGRYTGALALLREVVHGDLVPISPTASLEELSTHKFEKGSGYYLLDHIARETGPEAEFRWLAMCDALRHRGSFLVITTVDAPSYARRMAWQRPDLAKLLRALLGAAQTTVVDALLDQIPGDWSLTDVAELGRRLEQRPADVERALEVFDITATDEVRSWFDDPGREWTDFVEVAALAFAWGVGPRAFESMVADLERSARTYLPAGKQSDDDLERAAVRALSRRRLRSALIIEERATRSGIPREALVFRSMSHRRQVLRALWLSQPVPFWNGIRDWVHDLVDGGGLGDEQLVQVAQGVALLAEANAEEAIVSYLQPFAKGDVGEAGLVCASNVLRLMSLADDLAPMALQIAVEWVGGPKVLERLAAGEALMAELGARYPFEAAKRLWQLISQDELLDGIAFTAPAGLLRTLVELDGDPIPLLELLSDQMARLNKPRVTQETTDRTLLTVQHLLQQVDEPSRQLVSFQLLLAHPETATCLGRLWAGVLANRRYRAAALGAIWEGLLVSRDQAALADALTEALAAVLPADEQAQFVRDFSVIDGRKRQRDRKRAASLARLLIDAMARINGKTPLETR